MKWTYRHKKLRAKMWPVRTDVDPFTPTCIAVVHLGEVTNSGLSVNSITAAEKFLAKFTVH